MRTRILLITATFFAATPSIFAQKLWNGGEGNWSDTNSWVGGAAPASTGGVANIGRFTGSEPPAEVTISNTALATAIYVAYGATATFDMEAGSNLKTGSLWRIGEGESVADGAAYLTIRGPSTGTAQVNLTEGSSNNQFGITGGSSLILTGSGLTMTALGTSTIGNAAASNNNVFTVANGAIFNNSSMRVGQVTTTTTGSHGNRVIVNGGGVINLSEGVTSIGNNERHHSNSIEISGPNSRLELASGTSLLIGNSLASNLGGNALKVGNGGVVVAGGGISIFGHTAGSTDHGANRLVIETGGTLSTSSTILVGHSVASTFADGVLQLRSGGRLDGNGVITVNNGARFEAVGDGLGDEVKIMINDGGALAVLSEDEDSPGVLTVESGINFAAGSELEITLYENGVASTLDFREGGFLAGTLSLSLNLEGVSPEVGQTWTLFTGDTSLLTATFDLSGLDSKVWDVSRFNQQGAWQIRAIPEPNGIALFLGGSGVLAWVARRRRSAIAGAGFLIPALFAIPSTGLAVDEGAVVSVQASEVEIGEKSEMKFTAVLDEASADVERVLEFTAWYQAPKVAGYYAGMRVFWNHEELEDILDRPVTFKTRRGKEVAIRRGKMWQVPVLPSPEAARGDEGGKGAYLSDEVDVVRFRYLLPSMPAGEYECVIRNSMTSQTTQTYEIFPTLVVRDVEVRSVAK